MGGWNVLGVDASPDGRSVYASGGSAIAVLRRNPVTGALHQLPGKAGCIGPRRGCTRGHDLADMDPVVVSWDGRNVYAQGGGNDASGGYVLVFRRNRQDGSLRQLPRRSACRTVAGGPCRAFDLAIIRGGRHVYATPVWSVTGYARDPSTGALRELPRAQACLAHPDRLTQKQTLGCRAGRAIGNGRIGRLAASRDGRNLYVGGDAGIAVVRRSRRTGALTQSSGPSGCIAKDTVLGCASARFSDVGRVVVSRGGGIAYAQAYRPDGLFALRRDRAKGALSHLGGPYGCFTSTSQPGCQRVRGGSPAALVDFTLSPFGRNLYASFTDAPDEPETARDFVGAFSRVDGGGLQQLPGRAGCATAVAVRGCARVRKSFMPQSLVVSSDGRDLIVGSFGLRVFRRSVARP